MKKLIYSIIILTVTFIVACDVNDSDDTTTPAAPSTDANGNVIKKIDDGSIEANDSVAFRTLLADTVSRVWETNAFTLVGSSQSCRLDDVFTFFSDGNYDFVRGVTCKGEDDQANRKGTWELDFSAKKIYFDKGSQNEYSAEVIGLTEDELRIKGTYRYMGMDLEVRGLFTPN